MAWTRSARPASVSTGGRSLAPRTPVSMWFWWAAMLASRWSRTRGRSASSTRPWARAVAQVAEVALEPVVAGGEDLLVAFVLVEVPGDQKKGAIPAGAVAPLVAPPAGGDDPGQLAGRAHLVADVAHPLGVGGGVREAEHGLLGAEVAVGHPAHLFALRAIGGDALKVGPVRAEGG